MTSKLRNIIAYSVLALALLVVGVKYYLDHRSASREDKYSVLKGEVFHTFYQIKYDQQADYSALVDSTFRLFSQSLNPFDSTSLIAAINRNQSFQTDSMLRHVWQASRAISKASEGSYDVTCSPLINAWGFGFDSSLPITDQIIDSLKQFVGYQGVRLSGDSLIKSDPRMIFDFSSISKGYCADLLAQVLKGQGVKNYMVELGGEIAFRGLNPNGKPWRVGINKPIEDAMGMMQDLQLIVELDRPEGGLATSGNYRNFRILNGKKVAHTINPHTGYPIQTDVLSATIIAPSCMMADGLATACMTMSSAQIPEFIAQFPDVDYLLILSGQDENFRTIMSDGFRNLVVEEP
ncbi:MAG: FAD:protein FMN transferase [Porphyromonadaceae bacterium]|nr:FAD:protein FMN transferase [Porphyromonadaceae bacterium]